MSRRIASAMGAACLMALGLTYALPATADIAKPSAAQQNEKIATAKKSALDMGAPKGAVKSQDCYQVASDFQDRYNENPAAWGCAVSNEFTDYHGVPAQGFVYGLMVLSTAEGTHMVVSGYEYPNGNTKGLHFEWGPSDPWGYDTFLARINDSQEQCGDDHVKCIKPRFGPGGYLVATGGSMGWPATSTGSYSFTVEGYDEQTGDADQHWTSPVEWYVFDG